MTAVDDNAILAADELRDLVRAEMTALARVVKAALGQREAYHVARNYPPQHPYRLADRMIIAYLEKRYGV